MVIKNTQEIISVASVAATKLDQFRIQNDGEFIQVYVAYIIRLLSQVLRLPYKILLLFLMMNLVRNYLMETGQV